MLGYPLNIISLNYNGNERKLLVVEWLWRQIDQYSTEFIVEATYYWQKIPWNIII